MFFFENYTKSNTMTFDEFHEFYTDFSLFPDIVNFLQLRKIFCYLSEEYSSKLEAENEIDNNLSDLKAMSISNENFDINNKQIKRIETIDLSLFIDSLAISAMHLKFNIILKDLDKFLYLMERMNQSKGLKKLHHKRGKTL